MKRVLHVAVFVLCFTLLAAAESIAGNVRGQLLRRGPQGIYPASGIAVTVYTQLKGRSQPSYSGSDGMYYLYNIPAGRYFLEIWAHGFGNRPVVFEIVVNDQQPFTDVAPVTVP